MRSLQLTCVALALNNALASCPSGFAGSACADIDECLVNSGGCMWPRVACTNTIGSHYCYDPAKARTFPGTANSKAQKNHRVAVILVNGRGQFPNSTTGWPVHAATPWELKWFSAAQVGKALFTDPDGLAAFYKEVSYNRVSISGSVVGWQDDSSVTRSSSYIVTNKRKYMLNAYDAIIPSQYDVFMIVGLADGEQPLSQGFGLDTAVVPGAMILERGKRDRNGPDLKKGLTYFMNSRLFLEAGKNRFDGWITPSVSWAHEFFHTLGVKGNSNSLWCYPSIKSFNSSQDTSNPMRPTAVGSASVALSPQCVSKENGDPFSFMGERLWATHPSVITKIELGWVDSPNIVVIDISSQEAKIEKRDIMLYSHTDKQDDLPIHATLAVQVLVPEFSVQLLGTSDTLKFNRVTFESRTAAGFDRYLSALGRGVRDYSEVARWYVETRYNTTSTMLELRNPIDTLGALAYIDHSSTSSNAVWLLDGNPGSLGAKPVKSPMGYEGNAGKFASAMIPLYNKYAEYQGVFSSSLLPFQLLIANKITTRNGKNALQLRIDTTTTTTTRKPRVFFYPTTKKVKASVSRSFESSRGNLLLLLVIATYSFCAAVLRAS